jgi:hypothetical protein
MSVIGAIFITFAVIFVTAALFVGWVFFKIVQGMVRLASPNKSPRLVQAIRNRINPPAGMVRCSREICQNFNPPTARFCKCCGASLIAAQVKHDRSRPIRVRMTA